jgi:hypothetical protein
VKLPPPSTGLRQTADALEKVWDAIFTKLGEYERSGFSSKESSPQELSRGFDPSPHGLSASHHSLGNPSSQSASNHQPLTHLEHFMLLLRAFLPKLPRPPSMDWTNHFSRSRLATWLTTPTHLFGSTQTPLSSQHLHIDGRGDLSRFAAVMIGK